MDSVAQLKRKLRQGAELSALSKDLWLLLRIMFVGSVLRSLQQQESLPGVGEELRGDILVFTDADSCDGYREKGQKHQHTLIIDMYERVSHHKGKGAFDVVLPSRSSKCHGGGSCGQG